MIIRCTRVDRYVFDGLIRSSRTAQEWMQEAKQQADWFNVELFADFFSLLLPAPAGHRPG